MPTWSQHNMVDAIVATGAAIVDMDFFEALGHKHYQALEIPDDDTLRSLYIDRIYDTYIDEEQLQDTDHTIGEIADGAGAQALFLARVHPRDGQVAGRPTARRRTAWSSSPYEHDVPIFCPAFTDSSAGFGLVKHQVDRMKAGKPYLTLDSIADFRELTDIKIKAGTTGLLMIGGGVPKNFTQDTVVCAEILGHEDVEVHKYAVQITVADVRDGACSSSTLQEAASWGKVIDRARADGVRRGDQRAAAARLRRLSSRPLEDPGQARVRQDVRLRRLAGLAAALAFLFGAAAEAAEPVDLLIRHAATVDVAAGTVAAERAIAVRGGDIVAEGPDAEIAARYSAARTVDAAGAFAMPGLWDMHVHFGGGEALVAENRALLPIYLAYGITTVRDCAADVSEHVLRWRTETADGSLLGPSNLHRGSEARGTPSDLARHDRGRQPGRGRGRPGSPAGDAGRLRQDHRQYAAPRNLPLCGRGGAPARPAVPRRTRPMP